MNLKIVILGLGLLGMIPLKLLSDDTYNWTGASMSSENWGDPDNWDTGTVPNDPAAIVNVAVSEMFPVIIAVDSTYSVGTLNFSGSGNSNAWILDPNGTLNVYEAINNTYIAPGMPLRGSIGCGINLCGIVTITDTNTNTSSQNIDFAQPITGTGGITLSEGRVAFGGSSSYSGATTINGIFQSGNSNIFSNSSAFILANSSNAYLICGGDQTIGSLAGGAMSHVFVTLSTLTIGQDNTSTEYDGTIYNGIGGAGNIVKIGTGTLTLGGNNTYTGNTTVSGGTLVLNGVNSFSDTVTVSVSSGQLTLGNNGALGLAPLTMADSTTLGISDGITVSNGISITGNTNFSVASGTGVVSGVIGGSGSFTKTGSGALTLSGNNTYTGNTTVAQGSLFVNGSSASAFSIASGGTLRGNGTFGSITLESGGILAPGNSVGMITASSVNFDPGSVFQVEINPTEASSLVVTGEATLGGNVEVVQDAGSYGQQGQYLILDAASITGAFDPIVLGGSSGYIFSLSQMGNSLYLLYKLQQQQPIVYRISTSSLSGNALKVANYLNTYGGASTLKSLSTLSGNTLSQAIDSISPSRNAFGTYITEQVGFSLSNLLTTHIDKDRVAREESSKQSFVASLLVDASDRISKNKEQQPDDKFSGWISGFGEFAHQKAQTQNPSFNFISEAALAGFDYHAGKKGLAGGALGYAHTHFYDEADAGHGNINYYFASVYGNASIHHFYLSSAIWGVFNQNSNTRKISFPGFSQAAKADIFAWQCIPHLEVGYEFKYSWGGFKPFTAADWAISWQRAYTEKGDSPFNVSQKANNSSMVRSETGVKFCEKWQRIWGTFFFKEKISYVFEKPFGVGTVNTAFSGIPTAFTVNAVDHNLNLAVLGLDFLAAFGKNESWLVDFSYNGEIGVSYWSNDLTLSLTKHF